MIAGLIPTLVLVVAIVVAARRFGRSHTGTSAAGSPVRHFFQYMVTVVLLVLTTVGLSSMLGRALSGSSQLVSDQAAIARDLTFVFIAGPLLVLMVMWLRRSALAEGGQLTDSVAWLFATVAGVIALAMTLTSLQRMFMWLFALHPEGGWSSAVSGLVVWGAAWFGVWRAHGWLQPMARRPHLFFGSAIGFIVAVVGTVGALTAILEQLAGFGDTTLVNVGPSSVLGAVSVGLTGASAWAWYWWQHVRTSNRDTLWLTYVLLLGVGASLVMAVASATTALYKVLVWLVGDRQGLPVREHFSGMPLQLSFVIVGMLAWWYHERLVADSKARTEVNRMYDYIIAGIGLIAAAVGISVAVVAGIESATRSVALAGEGSINVLLAAATLILVGGPVWWWCWRRIHDFVEADRTTELGSATRRVYLYLLFGVGGLTALIALLIGAYQLFNDVVAGTVDASTLRDMRFAIGVLIGTAAVAGYHWTVYRGERDVEVGVAHARSVLLVGPRDAAITHAIAQATGARVRLMERSDLEPCSWPVDQVTAAVKSATSDAVVSWDGSAVSVLPVRGRL